MKRKKEFGCGHKGLGEFCHRCAQAKEYKSIAGDPRKLKVYMETKSSKSEKYTPDEVMKSLKEEAARLLANRKGIFPGEE